MIYTATVSHLPTASPRTLIQIRPPDNQRVKIIGADIGLQGSQPASTPIRLDWIVQTTAGTASSLTGQKQDRGADETIEAKLFKDFTVEPSPAAFPIAEISLHQQHSIPWYPPRPLIVKGGERVGLRYISGVFVNVSVTLHLEE